MLPDGKKEHVERLC